MCKINPAFVVEAFAKLVCFENNRIERREPNSHEVQIAKKLLQKFYEIREEYNLAYDSEADVCEEGEVFGIEMDSPYF